MSVDPPSSPINEQELLSNLQIPGFTATRTIPIEALATNGQYLKQSSSAEEAVSEVGMPPHYEGWTGAVRRYGDVMFYATALLEPALRVASRSNFAHRTGRENMMGVIEKWSGDMVVAEYRRFPCDIMVNVSSGVVAEYIDQMYQALTFTESDPGNSSGTRNRYDDVKLTYYASVNGLIKILDQKYSPNAIVYDIYDRNSFEVAHGLNWVD